MQPRFRQVPPSSGTFTVSSLGMFDLDDFVAIINPPESAILAVGKIAKTPVVVTNEEGEDGPCTASAGRWRRSCPL